MGRAMVRAFAQVLSRWLRAARRPRSALRPLGTFPLVKSALALGVILTLIYPILTKALLPTSGNTRLEAPSQLEGQVAAPAIGPRLPTTPPTTVPQVPAAVYIGDSSTLCYHRPGCSLVAGIDPGHKVPFASRGEAVGRGYRPCSRCNP